MSNATEEEREALLLGYDQVKKYIKEARKV